LLELILGESSLSFGGQNRQPGGQRGGAFLGFLLENLAFVGEDNPEVEGHEQQYQRNDRDGELGIEGYKPGTFHSRPSFYSHVLRPP
jgi:hypothetical protein